MGEKLVVGSPSERLPHCKEASLVGCCCRMGLSVLHEALSSGSGPVGLLRCSVRHRSFSLYQLHTPLWRLVPISCCVKLLVRALTALAPFPWGTPLHGKPGRDIASGRPSELEPPHFLAVAFLKF